MQSATLKVGDRVAFKASFMRSIGDYSHETGSKRGLIIAIRGDIARVMWDGGAGKSEGANIANLILADRIHLEPN